MPRSSSRDISDIISVTKIDPSIQNIIVDLSVTVDFFAYPSVYHYLATIKVKHPKVNSGWWNLTKGINLIRETLL